MIGKIFISKAPHQKTKKSKITSHSRRRCRAAEEITLLAVLMASNCSPKLRTKRSEDEEGVPTAHQTEFTTHSAVETNIQDLSNIAAV